MAIVFNCPQCNHPYRLPEKLAGKRATCKNPDCRKVIVIPQPSPTPGLSIAELGGIVPEESGKDQTPLPSNPADVEAAALAALSDSAREQEEAAAGGAIPMTCPHCDHHWTEPAAKAGKNTLCPNPECRQRVKVPEPKKGAAPTDWRTGGTNKPTLAKENFEQPDDVMSAQAKVVSKEAWTEGGGAEQELEPIPLKRRLFVATLIAIPVLLLVAGALFVWNWRVGVGETSAVQPAIDEFTQSGKDELSPAEAPLYSALLELAAGEYALRSRLEEGKALEQAFNHFAKARDDLRKAGQADPKAAGERAAAAGQLAVATLGLGGTDEQVKDRTRFRWVPETNTGRQLRVNEKTHTVYDELRKTLQLLQGADFDLRAAAARRLTRELVRAGQVEVAMGVPEMLFATPEQAEAKAVIALEIFRLDRGAEKPRQVADELKGQLSGGAGRSKPTPASAQTLWLVLETPKAPTVAPAPAGQQVSDPTRLAYVGFYLLKGDADKALELARRPGGSLGGQLRALALYADWAADPGPAADLAVSAITTQTKGKKDAPPVPSAVVFRLAQLAAAAGKTDSAKQLADLIPDDGLKAWAKGDAIRLASTSENKTAMDEAAAEVPADPKQLRAGHAWGRLWLARHNAKVSGDKGKETKAIANWPKGTVHPFGLAGIALGLQDLRP